MATEEKVVSKKKQSRMIRNVLCQPFSTPWPRINEEEAQLLVPTLKSALIPMKIEKLKAPWKDLRKLKKEERKEKTIAFLNSLPKEQKEIRNEALKLRDLLFFGINSVSRGVENKLVQFSVVADEVNPKVLIKHLVQLLYNAGIPVLLVPNLKTVTNDSIGFPCAAIGFKKMEDSNKNRFSELESEFMKLFNSRSCTNVLNENAKLESSDDEDDMPQAKINKFDSGTENGSPHIESIINKNCDDHKRKSSTNPSNLEATKNIKSDIPTESTPVNYSTNNTHYLPPVIKKTQSNPFKRRKTRK
ncbi:ribonuclease P protein subunit p38-like [Cimex lectularius]|uniref:Ribosomal protein L7Ae/L30e/S12e/Gadd45 domain-containing protein n=1 Tax=Cimex lectularius TaxID=79782 RepID=A0A8I6TMP9_CIMLE|nr:ribonuclease P protein subunit p38-like [Cimex lectularius]